MKNTIGKNYFILHISIIVGIGIVAYLVVGLVVYLADKLENLAKRQAAERFEYEIDLIESEL
jgi:hypothetical protein